MFEKENLFEEKTKMKAYFQSAKEKKVLTTLKKSVEKIKAKKTEINLSSNIQT